MTVFQIGLHTFAKFQSVHNRHHDIADDQLDIFFPELLSSENYRVYEVAAMVGYSLQTNFARDFHKQFGMTPTEYVNELQARTSLKK